jgi:hypothetical protein
VPVTPPLDAPPVDVLPPDALPPDPFPPLPVSGGFPLDEQASTPTEMPKENKQTRVFRLTGPPDGFGGFIRRRRHENARWGRTGIVAQHDRAKERHSHVCQAPPAGALTPSPGSASLPGS